MHYLITGHTGFKGSWLTLLLLRRGHSVSGLSLDPAPGGLFERARIAELLERDFRVDVTDAQLTASSIRDARPDVVIHMAAQPLVRESYRHPRRTFETNVMGTLNVIEAVQQAESVRAHVVVTTDKVYRNVDQEAGYRENDPLGGADPYSSSKAMADILTQSWTRSFPGVPTAVARAGNVIGGGDISPDRLFPDLLSQFSRGEVPLLRYPGAVRPWQHVLDCINGYLMLSEALVEGNGQGEWNFGPGRESFVPVAQVADLVAQLWGGGAEWAEDSAEHPHEANLLALDSAKAEAGLGWHNRLSFASSVEWTVAWARSAESGEDPRGLTLRQVAEFESLD